MADSNVTYGVQPLGLSNISRWYRQRKAAGLSTPEYMLTSALKAQLQVEADNAEERKARSDANSIAEQNIALGYANLDSQEDIAEAQSRSSMVSGLGQMATMGMIMDKDTIKNSFLGDMIWGGEAAPITTDAAGQTASFTGLSGAYDTASLTPSSAVPGAGGGAQAAAVGSSSGGAQTAVGSFGQDAAGSVTGQATSSVTEAASSAPAAAEVGMNSATLGVVGGAGIGSMIGGFLGGQLGGDTGGMVGSVAGGALGGMIVGMQAGSVGGPAGAVIGGVVGGLSSLLGGGK